MFLCNLITPVCGATKAEAEDKMALIDKLPLEIDALSLLAEALNFDFAAKGIDEPLTTDELQGMQGMLGIRDGVLQDVRQDQSERARLHHVLRPRPDPGRDRRRAEGDRRQAGRDVRRPRLRRLCHRGDLSCPAPTPISSSTSCRNCSAAGCSTRIMPARRCAKISGLRRPAAGAWKTQPQAAAE